MSKGVDRSQVFRTTRVRTALKNDASWILKSKDEEAGQAKAGTTHTEKSSPVRQNSYVLSAARKFGSIDSSVSPLQKTEVTPSEGDSTNHSNSEAIPAHKAREPQGSTVEAVADIKFQEATEKPVTNGGAHPETRGENCEAAGDKSNVEHSDRGAETPADVPVEDGIQPTSSVEENREAVPPVKPPEQSLAKTTSEVSEEPADTAADPSNTGHSEVGVTAAANVDDPSGEISVVDGTAEGNGTTEITAAAETSAQPEGENYKKTPAEQVTDEIVAASPEVKMESSTETIDVKSTASAEATSVVTSVASVPDIVESVSESPSQPASDIIAVDSSNQVERDGTEEIVAAAEVVLESLPAVSETTQAEEAAPHNAVQTVPAILSEPSAPPDAATAAEDNSDKHHAESATELVEAAAEVVLESSPATTAIINSTQEEDSAPHNDEQTAPDIVSEPAAPSAVEITADNISEEHPAGAGTEVTIEAAAEVAVESSPVISVVNETTQEAEAPTEEVQSTVEQSIDSTPQSAAVAELDIKNALEPAEASAAEAVQEIVVVDQTIKLTDALDVEIPETEAAPEPVEDPKPALSQPSQQCNGTNTVEDVQKPAEEPISTQNKYRYAKGICSFCDKKIDGTVKISLSDPLVECHPECLKCGVCELALGDLLKPMFLHDQMIQCGSCVAGALKI